MSWMLVTKKLLRNVSACERDGDYYLKLSSFLSLRDTEIGITGKGAVLGVCIFLELVHVFFCGLYLYCLCSLWKRIIK